MRTRAMQALDAKSVPYELLEFEAETFTAVEAAERLRLPPAQIFKTLVVRADDDKIILACVPADHELNLRALARAAGVKRVEMVDVGDLMRLVGYVKGAVSPVGTRRTYPTYIDRSALEHSKISVSAGGRGLQLWIDPRELIRATNALVEPIT
ncbi:MAG: aminoacyl-tRNA deacylase [Armatimonadota bacterium]|nr:aminoacyl-tRNA deacylase [Armatimonadota bacterium]